MGIKTKMSHIASELKGHAPFTLAGAVLGLLFMWVFQQVGRPAGAKVLFNVFHPLHVLLSSMVTASLFQIHRGKRNIVLIFLVGIAGPIAVATLSDSVIPFFGEGVLGVAFPKDTCVHKHNEPADSEHAEQAAAPGHTETAGQAETSGQPQAQAADEHEHEIKPRLHLGFIEIWYLVNPAAVIGILTAFFFPHSKFPHAGHILISTWASAAHIMMNIPNQLTIGLAVGAIIVLFIAVWIPCCLSDIVFPLLFVRSDAELLSSCACHNHKRHSHAHTHTHSEQCGQEKE